MPGLEPPFLFVYGTLRRGGSNDIARIAPDARFESVARVRGRLYDVNGRWPALVLDANADWVSGEIYAIPPYAWPALDALEDPVTPQRPAGAYFKVSTQAEVTGVAAMASLTVTLYTANPAATRLTRLIESGNWLAYEDALAKHSTGSRSSRRGHGTPGGRP